MSNSALAVQIALFLLLTSYPVSCLSTQDDSKELVLTPQEKDALQKFKFQVEDNLPEDFMKTDYYLLRWLRIAKLDIPTAQLLLERNVAWRKLENISNILSEDFSDISREYHMTFENARDRIGRPVGTIDLGDWDLRGAVLQGRQKRLKRYLTYSLEKGMQELFKAQKEAMERNVVITQGISLIDAEGGNVLQHLCPRCLSILIVWLQEMEYYYPRFVKEIIMVNAPSVTAIGVNAVRPFMSEETKRALKIFDMKKDIWMKYVDERIDRSQRTLRYGGTRRG